MNLQTLAAVFAHAAPPQKAVLIILAAMFLLTLAAAGLALAGSWLYRWRGLVGGLGMAGPMLGLWVGAMNSFHMARTIQRVPFDPTARQLAPGILEVATLVGLGAAVGLTAMGTRLLIYWAESRRRPA